MPLYELDLIRQILLLESWNLTCCKRLILDFDWLTWNGNRMSNETWNQNLSYILA